MANEDFNGHEIFEAVAGALIAASTPDRIKVNILAATMDMVGVPMGSLEKYREDAAIVALFRERGVRFVDDTSPAQTSQHEDDGQDAPEYPGEPGTPWIDYDGDTWILGSVGRMWLITPSEEPDDPAEVAMRWGPMVRRSDA